MISMGAVSPCALLDHFSIPISGFPMGSSDQALCIPISALETREMGRAHRKQAEGEIGTAKRLEEKNSRWVMKQE